MRPIVIGVTNNTTGKTTDDEIQKAVAALNIQITKHLRKCWDTVPEAFVHQFPKDKVPLGVWQVDLVDDLGGPGSAFHATDHGQPYAKVAVHDKEWTIAASHEILEMLVDPTGNGLHVGRAITCRADKRATQPDDMIEDGNGVVQYLLEVCDPCEDKAFAYKINDTWVSDFVTPDFYACMPVPGARHSFRGNIELPRRILPGGYITWLYSQENSLYARQVTWLGSEPKMGDPVPVPAAHQKPSLRAFIDAETHRTLGAHRYRGKVFRPERKRGELKVGEEGIGRGKLDEHHWVTYHEDGVIERKLYKKAKDAHPVATCVEVVKAHEPIFRPRNAEGCEEHLVTHLGCTPIIPFDKDLIRPDERKALAIRNGRDESK